MGKQSVKHTLTVALMLCLGCSVLVSAAAIGLKPRQEANRLLDRNKNILGAAGMLQPGQSRADIDRLFAEFEVRLVNLDTGRYATEDELKSAGIDPRTYDQRKAARDPALSVSIKGDDLSRRLTPVKSARSESTGSLLLAHSAKTSSRWLSSDVHFAASTNVSTTFCTLPGCSFS